MKNKTLLLVAVLSFLLSTNLIGQTIRDTYVRIPVVDSALIDNTDQPKKILTVTQSMTLFKYSKGNVKKKQIEENKITNQYKSKFLTQSQDYPDYISTVELADFNAWGENIKVVDEKLGTLNTYFYRCEFKAFHHITDIKNKVTYTHEIKYNTPKFQDGQKIRVDDYKKRSGDYVIWDLGDATNLSLVIHNVSAINSKKYMRLDTDGNLIVPEDILNTLMTKQYERIEAKAYQMLNRSFYDQHSKVSVLFNYIKKFKDHDPTRFNSAMQGVDQFMESGMKNRESLDNSLAIWKDELSQFDISNKKHKKFCKAAIENIIKTHYLVYELDSVDLYYAKLLQLSKKYNKLGYFTKKRKIYTPEELRKTYGLTVQNGVDHRLTYAYHFYNKSPDRINKTLDIYRGFSERSLDLMKLCSIKKITDSDMGEITLTGQNYIYYFFLNGGKMLKGVRKLIPEEAEIFEGYCKKAKDLKSHYNKVSNFDVEANRESINSNITTYIDTLAEFKGISSDDKELLMLLCEYKRQIGLVTDGKYIDDEYKDVVTRLKLLLEERIAAKKAKLRNSSVGSEIYSEILYNVDLTSDPLVVSNLSEDEISNLNNNIITFFSYHF